MITLHPISDKNDSHQKCLGECGLSLL